MSNHLVISTNNDLLRIPAQQIIYFTSDGNYCNLLLVGGEMRMLTNQLGQIESMIEQQLGENGKSFIRVGRGLIININHLFYINLSKQQIILADNTQGRYTTTASKEALKALKDLIESNIQSV